jgi:hypothetical protein
LHYKRPDQLDTALNKYARCTGPHPALSGSLRPRTGLFSG